METYALIYDVVRKSPTEFSAHYRLYDEDRNQLSTGDYVYTVKKMRKMMPSELKSKIITGIKQREMAHNHIKKGGRLVSSCLVTTSVLKAELDDLKAMLSAPKNIVEKVTSRVEVEHSPRIFKVVLVGDTYTIVKAEKPYLTREQAKEELFAKQLEEK